MNNQDQFMKIQTCVLRVNIHCDGCKQKVRKILQKFDGVYGTCIDAEQGRVTVSGCFDPAKLIKKLEKSGKHAELWSFKKGSSNNQNQVMFNNQFKNMYISDSSTCDRNKNIKPQKGVGKEQPKSGTQQVVQHVKGGNKDPKTVKFNKADPEEFGMGDHDFDEYDDDDVEFDDDDDFDDEDDFSDEDEEFGHGSSHGHNLPDKGVMSNNKAMQGNGNYHGPHGTYGKMAPMMGDGNGAYGPKNMINMHGRTDKISGLGVGGGGSFKKGGVIDFPVEVKGKKGEAKEGKNGSGNGGGKKGGGKGKGGGKEETDWKSVKKQCGHGEKTGVKKKKGGGLRGLFGFGKNKSCKGGGSVSKKGSSNNGGLRGDDIKGSNGQKGAGKHNNTKHKNKGHKTKNEFELDFTTGLDGGNGQEGKGGAKIGQMGNMGGSGDGGRSLGAMGHGGNGVSLGQRGMGPMGNYTMAQMGGHPAVQGLPAQAMMSGGHYQGIGQVPGYGGPGNPYSRQQQYMAMMMNQQRDDGNMFPPMYSRSYPVVTYAQPPSHRAHDNLTNFFSDENTESCNVM